METGFLEAHLLLAAAELFLSMLKGFMACGSVWMQLFPAEASPGITWFLSDAMSQMEGPGEG